MKVILKQKRSQILERYRHPWVFSKGMATKPDYPAGSIVAVVSESERHLGWAFYHPKNNICLRMVSFEAPPPDGGFWRKRIRNAMGLRQDHLPGVSNYRLIHGENDGFPGLTVDVFGELICLQVNSAGMAALIKDLAPVLAEITQAKAVFERSEGHARKQEGLSPTRGFLLGEMAFPIQVEDRGFKYFIDPSKDQKTGFYLDQRPQHHWLEQRSKDKTVLDLCAYTGAFTMAALRGGAREVCSVDSSTRALELLAAHLALNELPQARHRTVQADLFQGLDRAVDGVFDMVILDPPALAKSLSGITKAQRTYRKLNGQAAAKVVPNGLFLTFSCSGVVSPEDFRQSVFLGLQDSGREGRIITQMGPGPDHPINLRFPEGNYLNGLALHLT